MKKLILLSLLLVVLSGCSQSEVWIESLCSEGCQASITPWMDIDCYARCLQVSLDCTTTDE